MHTNIQKTISTLAINYDELFGRDKVSKRSVVEVYSGEVLMIAKLCAKIFMPDEVYSHCSNLLQV